MFSPVESGTALVFPMAIKEHIDHFIVREAGIVVAKQMGSNARAAFYFQEDKPYGGIATRKELEKVERFAADHSLEPRAFEYDPE